ncbi:MAG: FAD-binding oxidoreductase [Planctomycetes bacterium]|nr:FAD-binding oxidoreductase [Planctomycetota bacterium]
MQDSADIVVIGGGCIGVSVAYHLAKRGAGKVVLLERDEFLGQESTGKCAVFFHAPATTEINTRLSLLSIDAFERWGEEIQEPLQYWQWGYCFLLTNNQLVASFKKSFEMWNRLGMDAEWWEPAEVEKRLPYVNMDGVQGATFYARDGFGDPSDITQGYAKAARRHDAVIENNVEVTGLKLDENGREVVGVKTNQGDVACSKVVLCTGAWTRDVAGLVGVDVPVEPIRRQIIVTDKFEDIKDPFPMTVDLSTTLYFHRESGGILIGMSDQTESAGYDDSFNEEFGEQMLMTAMERAPVLENASPKHKWAGLYEVTPDHHPVMDKLGHIRGGYVCAGFRGHGLMHAPAAGTLMAELILDGRATSIDISALELARFSDPSRLHDEANVI